MEWIQFAQLASSIVAACGLVLTAWHIWRTRRSSDLQALQKFFEEASNREAALAEARNKSHEAWQHSLYELMNFLEVYACAYNNRLIIGRGTRKIIRHKLEDCFIEVEANEELQPHLAKASDRSTTFAELVKFIKRHRKEVDRRKGERARFQAVSTTVPEAPVES